MGAKRRAGLFGIVGIIVFLICAVISAAAFEDGAFSPINRFISELGVYIHGYFIMSPALIYNIGLIIAGILFCVFAVMHGIQKRTALDVAAGFFGILAGVLIAAQGLITLNYTAYHLMILAAFFASVFLMCVFTVIAQVRSREGSSLAVLIIAFIAGAAAAISSVYILTGGLDKTFGAGASPVARPDIMPCAILQWGVYALLLLLFFVQSASMFTGDYEDEEYEDDEYEEDEYEEDEYKPEPPPAPVKKRWSNKRDIDF